MKKFLTITMVTTAGIALAACGGTKVSNQSKQVHHNPPPVVIKKHTPTVGYSSKHFTPNGNPELVLPHVGDASKTIRRFASSDQPYLKQLLNSKDWVQSKTFGGQWIFVGPYTSGVSRQRIRDAKALAMNTMETFVLEANYKQTWPSVLNGFNYDAFGEGPSSQAAITSFYKSGLGLPHSTMIAAVPSEATIAESPVGMVTAAQMNNPKGQPQYTTQGICVPHEFNIKYASGGNAINGGLGFSTTQEYFAGYGNPSVLILNLTANGGFTNGVESSVVKSCANFS